MRCIVSCSSTSSPWLLFFLAALLWGSMIHKHTGRWISRILELREMLLLVPNWFKPFQCYCHLRHPGQNLKLGTIISYNWTQVLEACDCLSPFSLITVLMQLVLFVINILSLVVAFPCFTVVNSFTSGYAPLLLFFLRVSSISLHGSTIQFSFALFMHFFILLCTSLYFSDPSGSNLFFLSSFLLLHTSRISAGT